MKKELDKACLFCNIVSGVEPATKVWEDENFLAIENKFPEAPIHILVMPKWHIEKLDTRKVPESFWHDFMKAVWTVVEMKGLDKVGYKLENNGAGYNHLEHEHMHVISGLTISK